MTKPIDLQTLKTIAKRLARVRRVPHHEALDLVASDLGKAHWNALSSAWRQGWRPDSAALEGLSEKKNAASPHPSAQTDWGFDAEEQGYIDGHHYTLSIDLEVLMGGKGWAILVEQAPSAKPEIEIYDERQDNPILNPEFVSKALAICNEAAERLRARIAADWPRRSTKPDGQGRAQHPLFKGLSNRWHCLHCDGASTGAEMAANMWHCPRCSATPIDIHSEPFWMEAS